MSTQHASYRPDIDGLRAVAVLLVVIHHVAPTLLPGGFIGVDVFFVISGFLITGILDASMQAGTFRYVDFVWRRCRRIVPALATVLAATLLIGLCILTGPELVNLSRHLIAGSLSASNVLLWHEVGYFDSAAVTKPLLHLWSLGVEEQFYLLWPLFLIVLPLQRRIRILGVALVVMLSLMLSENLAYSDPSHAFYLLHSRAWELGAGGLLALILPVLQTRLGRSKHGTDYVRDIASFSGAAILLGSACTHKAGGAWPGVAALTPVLGTTLLIGAGPRAIINRSLLSLSVARWLGQRSYPLYLWHWPPLAFLHILASERGFSSATVNVSAVLLMFVAVALAHLTFVAIEQPAQRRAAQVFRDRVISLVNLRPYGIAFGSLVVIGFVVMQLHGLPQRYSTQGADATVVLRDASPDSITAYREIATRCKLNDAGTATWCWRIAGTGRGVAVFGDSHAEVIFAGLAAQRSGVPMFLTGRKGCAPVLNVQPIADRLAEICRKAMALAHDAIVSDTSISTVLLVSRGPSYLSGAAFGIDSLKPVVPLAVFAYPADTIALAHAYESGIERSIRSLLAANKRVILVLDVPELGFQPDECLIGRPFGLRRVRTPCALTLAVVNQRNAGYRALVAQLQTRIPALEVIDASVPLCNASACNATRGGRLLYSDGNHLTLLGSRIVTRAMAPLIFSKVERTLATAVARQ
jgi:peptidoglycan/LPS O-acetylase OafA/YrhL